MLVNSILILVFSFVFTKFVYSIVIVRGSSMVPTLNPGEIALVPRYETWLHRLGVKHFERNDIVFFRSPIDQKKRLIKRIIATPGDRIIIDDGLVYLNGDMVFEPHLDQLTVTTSLPEIKISPGKVFVLSDNRRPLKSLDSRHFGQIPFGSIEGRASIILWPPFVNFGNRINRNIRILD